LKDLAKSKSKFDAVIIETTGLADPAPVAQTFFVDDEIQGLYRLDGIVTMVDVKHAMQHFDEVKPEGVENESIEQVAFADRVLLNKIDLVDEATITAVERRVKSINSSVGLFKTTHSKIDPKLLLNINAFSLDRVVAMDPEFLDVDGEHQHDDAVSSVSFKFDGEVNVAKMQDFISKLLMEKGTDLFRYKGLLSVKGMQSKFLFQGVHMLFQGAFDDAYSWRPNQTRECRFVFIGRNLDKKLLEDGFLACKVTTDLRFNVGDAVLASCEGGFQRGNVIAIWDDGNPYRIKLAKSGIEVWAPEDDNAYIKPAP